MPTFGSLFAGIGGIDLGLERAGWECRFQVEWDGWCQWKLGHIYPDTPRDGDITLVDWTRVERVDLLAGGFPCQPVSAAGQQAAQADERWLWPEFHRAIRELRPRFVLVENVTNLLAVNDATAFGDVLGDLASSGYDAEWDCIPASAVGAPHDRDRLWIVAYPRCVCRERRGDGGVVGSTGSRAQGEAPGDHGAANVAHPDGIRREGEWGSGLPGDRNAPLGDDADRCRGEMAHTYGEGLEGRVLQPERIREWLAWARGMGDADSEFDVASGSSSPEAAPAGRPLVPSVRGGEVEYSAVARGSAPGGRAEPGLGGGVDGLPARLDRHRWPAPPNAPQYPWEPPRVVTGSPDRTRRLKALGNAVVPQVVEVIGRRLIEVIEAAA